MAKLEYLSLEGLRIDGRRVNEVRNIDILCGTECSVDVVSYDGVAQVSQGLTKVQALVKGPIETLKSKLRTTLEETDSVVEIKCEAIMPCEKKANASKNDRQIADLTNTVVSTFERVIVGHLYKNSAIYIFVNVLESDGGVKSTVLNAVTIALVEAGIAMKDLIFGCTSALLRNTLFLDPNQQEIGAAIMELNLAVSASTDEIMYLDLRSENPIKSVAEIIQSSIDGTKQFSELAKLKLKEYAHKILELNRLDVTMRNVQRIKAPIDYKWEPRMFLEKLRENPFDFIFALLFICHIIGYFCLLVLLKIKHCQRKLFAVLK